MDTIWTTDIFEAFDGPRYAAVADALAEAVASGALRPGDRLPTHRELADRLGVTVGTVTRGYAEAERRGLTVGEVGRGTFVRERRTLSDQGWGAVSATERLRDLSLCIPVRLESVEEEDALARTLRDIADSPCYDLLRYLPGTATRRQREVAAGWVRELGVPASAEDVLVVSGVQHGLTVALSSLLRPGDTVAAAHLTYPGLKSLAGLLGLDLVGLDLDEHGVVPASLERACATRSPRALYLVPNGQNPTGVMMPEGRRKELAGIAEAHGVVVLEDDVHGPLVEESLPPIARLYREGTIYLTSLSKALNTGLRVGFMVTPPAMAERLAAGIRSTVWMTPPLMTEVATRWIEDGTARTIMERKLEEVRARQRLVREVFGDLPGSRHLYHAWLPLPEPWRSDEVVALARQRGLRLAGAGAFAVGRRDVPHALRIAVGNVRSRAELKAALEELREILEDSADPCMDVI